jgi:hypothetical protein
MSQSHASAIALDLNAQVVEQLVGVDAGVVGEQLEPHR